MKFKIVYNKLLHTDLKILYFLGKTGIKLLGVAPLTKKAKSEKAGPIIADATFQLLDKWKCKDCIKSMVFDTTHTNTGHLTAACVSIQERLSRQLLWCACRHHIGEIVLTHIWQDLKIETSKGPDILLFKRLRENFNDIKIDDQINLELNYALINEKSPDIIDFCKRLLKEECPIRGDYKELLQLILIYLDHENNSYNIQAPGAVHHARWMSKLIYCLKIVLLKNKIIDELPKAKIFTPFQIDQLHRFVDFFVFIYVPWWYTAIFPENAAQNDLQFWISINEYKDELISKSAAKSFKNHTWYLTEELVCFCLFSDTISVEKKTKIVTKLKSFDKVDMFTKRHGYKFGKPILPDIEINELSSFVGESSWYLFELLDIDTEFMNFPTEQWESLPAYIDAKEKIMNIRVVNDSAERGVKLASDFLSTAQIEQRYQNILQVVENDRNSEPNLRCRKIKSKSWFLKL